jgi:hypothetical protein
MFRTQIDSLFGQVVANKDKLENRRGRGDLIDSSATDNTFSDTVKMLADLFVPVIYD